MNKRTFAGFSLAALIGAGGADLADIDFIQSKPSETRGGLSTWTVSVNGSPQHLAQEFTYNTETGESALSSDTFALGFCDSAEGTP